MSHKHGADLHSPSPADMYPDHATKSRPVVRMPILPDSALSERSAENELFVVFGCLPFAIGIRRFGVVDGVPGCFSVATLFFHIMWIPIIPLRTCLFVLGATNDGSEVAVPIPISVKSILIAWTRAATSVAGVVAGLIACVGAIAGIVGLDDDPKSRQVVIVSAAIAVVCFFIFAVAWQFKTCSAQRGEKLALLLGFPPETASRFTQLACLEERVEEQSVSGSIPCPKCGRTNSPSTRVCPRCETRLR